MRPVLVRWAGAIMAALALPGLLAGCQRQAEQPRVDPLAYDAYYLWPAIAPPPASHPRALYLLDGEVRRGGGPRFMRLRGGVPRLPDQELWLVVRIDRLDLDAASYDAILADLRRWQATSRHLAGLQVDFDAGTRGIKGYANFLRGLRARLPARWKLSITGLMDWSAHGDPQVLADLRGVVDEVVVQTYQRRDTIPGYEAYFARMDHFPIPFRVALVEGGQWAAPTSLAHHPMFRGYVVFLLRPRHGR